ncbi:MAG: VOC family protein [Gammaproteobacteria bacterium]
MRLVSHVSIGVRDIERSLHFYRDLLGMEVIMDRSRSLGKIDGIYSDDKEHFRREIFLRWHGNEDIDNVFISISTPEGQSDRKPLRFEDLGIHHVGFWVDDLEARMDRLRKAGCKVVYYGESDGEEFAENKAHRVVSAIVEDPDGTLLQFDQRFT